MLRPFKLHEPASVDDAVSLLGHYGEEAKVYCGGTELLLAMKEGLLRYNHLVNIKTVSGLDEVSFDSSSGVLSIGAAVTHSALEQSYQIQSHFPMIAQAEGNVANVRVRNVGTIGGNLCFSEPHSDPGAFLLLFDAQVQIQGTGRRRTITLAELTLGPFETCLEDDEILTAILVPQFPQGMTGAYLKFGYHVRPTLGVGVAVRLDGKPGDGEGIQRATVAEARVSVGSAGPKAKRVPEAEDLVRGKTVADLLPSSNGNGPSPMAEAGRLSGRAADPMDDIHGSAEYKEHMIGVFLRRAFAQAIQTP
ncbi:MAG: xanthine dehydrogenase family protein subunit M [Chloroflexota bacterium]|nr:xanthine dehydrogenase family protein subunit M [Chloroflexota bacterium]